MNNIKYCENCRKEIQKEQMVIYRKKVKIIKYLQNIECELKKLDDFDFVKYNLYINSVTNKKNNVEKYSLEELNEYYNSLKNLLTKT